MKKFESFTNNFCVYVFLNPCNPGKFKYENLNFDFEPIYVGKGRLSRPKDHIRRFKNINTYFYNKLKKIVKSGFDPIWIILKADLTEIEAFYEEIRVISLIGRKKNGGTLYNSTDGGEGQTGLVHSEESKIKISNSLKNNKEWLYRMKSKEHRDNLSKSLMGHIGYGKGVPRTQEVKDKIKNSVTGDKNHFFGKTHSDELKNKYSQKYSGKGNPNSKVYIIKMDEEMLRFEGRLELKEFLNNFNSKNNLKLPKKISFDNLLSKGFSKNFKLISIQKPC